MRENRLYGSVGGWGLNTPPAYPIFGGKKKAVGRTDGFGKIEWDKLSSKIIRDLSPDTIIDAQGWTR